MTKQGFVSFVLFTLVFGCASPHVIHNNRINRDFKNIDSLRIENTALGESIEIDDAETIARLRKIHRRATWDPMPATMPIDLIAIYGVNEGEHEFKLVYGAGWLMDTKDETIVRWPTLNSEDREWMQAELRAKLPPLPNVM